ncbi:hypothetical protein KIMH_09280 [Bombiscardovia apis]|uniref:DUF3710 domain-containing protein n=1 Tax=Bombiscardovia apis TaxID=2932182 RepID=A0ABM8BD51_9BIFI|nr:DUF3710 domain-containing protein [Bombiscardovia apis]BDR54817.1 hypothetical protein KIMH_09280 [Bombiscardovia apis]
MGWFGFGKKHKSDDEGQDSKSLITEESQENTSESVEDEQASDSDLDQERGITRGPWDVNDEEVVNYDDYLDIGAVNLPYLQGIELRIKANGQSGDIMGATISYGQSSLEVEAFAAPKTLGLWDTVRHDLKAGNPKAREVEGTFGTELMLPVTVKGKEFTTRIVGVDGPRWMLRGIFSGPAASKGKERETLDTYFSNIVVDRGEEPLAPRDLIPMHQPITPDQRAAEKEESEGDDSSASIPGKPTGPFDSDQQTEVKTTLSRGPMFSEVR